MPDKNAAAHRVLNNAKIFRELGYHVIFVGLSPSANERFLDTKYEYSGFEIYELKCGGAVDKIKKFSTFEWLDELFLKYDVAAIIAYDYYAIGLYKLKKICNRKKIPIIADTDEWFSATGSSMAEKVVRKLDSELRMRLIQPKADGIITISKFLYHYYSNKTVTVKIPPLVDLEDEKYCNSKTKNIIPTLVYSGSPSATKEALGDVVQALNNLTDVDFKVKIVGIDKEDFLRIYHVEPDFQKIEFLGRISHKESLDIVKLCDYSVMIRPKSRVTMAGFPTKFVEAISCGTAVIANDISDLADYLKDSKNGYLVDENNLEEELRRILSIRQVPEIEKNTFDYRRYFDPVRELLKGVGLE